ncbi:SRPBCC family protein [Ulvibacterium marinum]|uniref:SRPBCC family protein n=1 Tax=Ulvibacterium marinum TaxID=2419782 RepID=A0A3B0CB51_9FLAO|nr:SRPBCC family protein [Ulvibacterium marinum]RKN80126.1 SRPBCC family protein [Ulvibacterium marinum]
MKYTTEITIDIPIEAFVQKLDNPDNMKHWQRGLVSYKQLSDTPGAEGAQMELHYKMGKRDMVLIETILRSNFPHEFHATYDTKGVHNIQKNYFKDIDGHSTQWISEAEFQFSSFMMKVMGFFMPGAFKKQSQKYAEDFKAFAEKGISVADT